MDLEDENTQGISDDIRRLEPQTDPRISDSERRYTPNRRTQASIPGTTTNNEFSDQDIDETGEVPILPIMEGRKSNAIQAAENHIYIQVPTESKRKLNQLKSYKMMRHIEPQYFIHRKPEQKQIVRDDKYTDILRDFGRRRKYETDLLSRAAESLIPSQPDTMGSKLVPIARRDRPQRLQTLTADEHLVDAHNLNNDKLVPIKDFTEFQNNKESEISLVQDIEDKDFQEYLQSIKKASAAIKKEDTGSSEASQMVPINEYREESEQGDNYRISVPRTSPLKGIREKESIKRYPKKEAGNYGISQALQLNEYSRPSKKESDYRISLLAPLNEYHLDSEERNNYEMGVARRNALKDITGTKQSPISDQKTEADDYGITGMNAINIYTHNKGLDGKRGTGIAMDSSLKGTNEKDPLENYRTAVARQKAGKDVNDMDMSDNYEIVISRDSPLREDHEIEKPVNRVTQAESMSSLKGEHEKEMSEYREASDRIPSVKESHENVQGENSGTFQYKFEPESDKDGNIGRRTVNNYVRGDTTIPYSPTNKEIENQNYEVKQYHTPERESVDSSDHSTYSTLKRYESEATPRSTEQTIGREEASERLMRLTENPTMLSTPSVYIKPSGIALNVKPSRLDNMEQDFNDKYAEKYELSNLIKGDIQDPTYYGQKVSKLVENDHKKAMVQDKPMFYHHGSIIDSPLGYKWAANLYSGVYKPSPVRKTKVNTNVRNRGILLGRNFVTYGKTNMNGLFSSNEVKNIIPKMKNKSVIKEGVEKKADIQKTTQFNNTVDTLDRLKGANVPLSGVDNALPIGEHKDVANFEQIPTEEKNTIVSPPIKDKDKRGISNTEMKQVPRLSDIASSHTDGNNETTNPLSGVDNPLPIRQDKSIKSVPAETKNKIITAQEFVMGSKIKLLKKLTATKEDLLADGKPNKERIEDEAYAMFPHREGPSRNDVTSNLIHNDYDEFAINDNKLTIKNNNKNNNNNNIKNNNNKNNNNNYNNNNNNNNNNSNTEMNIVEDEEMASNNQTNNSSDSATIEPDKGEDKKLRNIVNQTAKADLEVRHGNQNLNQEEITVDVNERNETVAKPGAALITGDSKEKNLKNNMHNKTTNASQLKESEGKLSPMLDDGKNVAKGTTEQVAQKQGSSDKNAIESTQKDAIKVETEDKNHKETTEKDGEKVLSGEKIKKTTDTQPGNEEKVGYQNKEVKETTEKNMQNVQSKDEKVKETSAKDVDENVKETSAKDVDENVKETPAKDVDENVKETPAKDIQKLESEDKKLNETIMKDIPTFEGKKKKELRGQTDEKAGSKLSSEEIKNNQPRDKEASKENSKDNNLKDYLEKKLEEKTEKDGGNIGLGEKKLNESDMNHVPKTDSQEKKLKQGMENETQKANLGESKAKENTTKESPKSDSEQKAQKDAMEKADETKEELHDKTMKGNSEKELSTVETEKMKNSETMQEELIEKKIKESPIEDVENMISKLISGEKKIDQPKENTASSVHHQAKEATTEEGQLKPNLKEETPKAGLDGNKLNEIEENAAPTAEPAENKIKETSENYVPTIVSKQKKLVEIKGKEMPIQDAQKDKLTKSTEKDPTEKKLKVTKEKTAQIPDAVEKKLKEATEKAGAVLDSKENKLKETMEKMASTGASDEDKVGETTEGMELKEEREKKKLKAAMLKTTTSSDPEEKKLKELLNKKVEEIMERFRKEKQSSEEWTGNEQQSSRKKIKTVAQEDQHNEAEGTKVSKEIGINETKETFKDNPAFGEREARKEFKEMADNNDETSDKQEISHELQSSLKDDVDNYHNKTFNTATKNVIESMPNPFADIGSIPDGPAYNHVNTQDTKGTGTESTNTELAEIIKSHKTNAESNPHVGIAELQHASERDTLPGANGHSHDHPNLFLKRGLYRYSDAHAAKKP